jgi:hypothetical protein
LRKDLTGLKLFENRNMSSYVPELELRNIISPSHIPELDETSGLKKKRNYKYFGLVSDSLFCNNTKGRRNIHNDVRRAKSSCLEGLSSSSVYLVLDFTSVPVVGAHVCRLDYKSRSVKR